MEAGSSSSFGVILGLYRDNGKLNGNYRDYPGFVLGLLGIYIYILGLYRDNRKYNGNYHLGFRVQGLGFKV